MNEDAMTREAYEQACKTLDPIVLFPGSLEELNSLGERYKFIPLQGGEKFLIGGITLRLSDLWLHITVTHRNTGGGLIENVKGPASTEEFGVLKGIVEEQYLQMGLSLFERDIRHRAMVGGADGLVHVQLYSAQSPMYMGVPVKRNIDPKVYGRAL
ncbi:MAG TPA: hypothetical protein VJJ79_00315 [Candidatus Nanoarchaeia archaeon]|nr:hypothetical protein [Candidatus Nanoarchaeia archaeon]